MLNMDQGTDVNPNQESRINWRGLFTDNAILWVMMVMFASFVIAVLVQMFVHKEFEYEVIDKQQTQVQILSVFRVVSQRLIVQEPISGHAIEVELPYSCNLIKPLEGKTVTTLAVTYFREYDGNTYLDFPEIEKQICVPAKK